MWRIPIKASEGSRSHGSQSEKQHLRSTARQNPRQDLVLSKGGGGGNTVHSGKTPPRHTKWGDELHIGSGCKLAEQGTLSTHCTLHPILSFILGSSRCHLQPSTRCASLQTSPLLLSHPELRCPVPGQAACGCHGSHRQDPTEAAHPLNLLPAGSTGNGLLLRTLSSSVCMRLGHCVWMIRLWAWDSGPGAWSKFRYFLSGLWPGLQRKLYSQPTPYLCLGSPALQGICASQLSPHWAQY